MFPLQRGAERGEQLGVVWKLGFYPGCLFGRFLRISVSDGIVVSWP